MQRANAERYGNEIDAAKKRRPPPLHRSRSGQHIARAPHDVKMHAHRLLLRICPEQDARQEVWRSLGDEAVGLEN
jgi:hypothetical protein